MLDYAEAHEEFKPYAFLYLFTYVFLLRLPSEALPAIAGGPGIEGHSVLECRGDKITVKLRSRKNRPQGSCLERGCWRVGGRNGLIALTIVAPFQVCYVGQELPCPRSRSLCE